MPLDRLRHRLLPARVRRSRAAAQQRDQRGQVTNLLNLRTGDEAGLGGVAHRDDDPRQAGIDGAENRGQDAGDGPHPPVQAQLADQHSPLEGTVRAHIARGEDGRRDRDVERASRLRQGRR